MYEKNGKTISFEEAGRNAEFAGMELADWAQEFGWTESAGKTAGSSEQTQAMSPGTVDSYLGDSYRGHKKVTLYKKRLKD